MNLRVTPAAVQDLKEIKNYISQNLSNPSAAERVIRKIVDSYLQLSDSPYIGISLSSKIKIITPYRYLISGKYLVFYKVNSEFVEISRIIYGRRDYIKILLHDEYDNFIEETDK